MSRVLVGGLLGGGGGGGGFSFADMAYNAGDYTTNGTWTVAAFTSTNYIRIGTFAAERYVSIFLTNTVIVSAGASNLHVAMPFTAARRARVAGEATVGGVPEDVFITMIEGTNDLQIARTSGAGWVNSTVTLGGQLMIST